MFLVTMAKSIGNGYPLAAVVTTPGIYLVISSSSQALLSDKTLRSVVIGGLSRSTIFLSVLILPNRDRQCDGRGHSFQYFWW